MRASSLVATDANVRRKQIDMGIKIAHVERLKTVDAICKH